MDDNRIIELFFKRSDEAIKELAKKYEKLIQHIAFQYLGNEEDTGECVDDTYMSVWNSIPPQRPDNLKAYVCRIARNRAINLFRAGGAQKRSAITVAIDELIEDVSCEGVEEEIEAKELGQLINNFLDNCEKDMRAMFVRRYYMGESIKEIAEQMSCKENTVIKKLSRTKSALKQFLEEEGYRL